MKLSNFLNSPEVENAQPLLVVPAGTVGVTRTVLLSAPVLDRRQLFKSDFLTPSHSSALARSEPNPRRNECEKRIFIFFNYVHKATLCYYVCVP